MRLHTPDHHISTKRILIIALCITVIAAVALSAVFLAVSRHRVTKHTPPKAAVAKVAAEGNPLDGSAEAPVMTEGEYALYYDASTAVVTLLNTRSGAKIATNPTDRENDTLARGKNMARLRSQVVLTYMNADGESQYAYSSTDCVDSENHSVSLSEEGLTVHYIFADTGIELSLVYAISDTGLTVRVPAGSIVDSEEYRLIKFDLLPFCGAAGSNEKGMLLLPDGIGSAACLNNGKATGGPITLNIYGNDRSEAQVSSVIEPKEAIFPMFALIHEAGESAAAYTVLANASEGEFGGQITAYVAGRETSYNTAYFTFVHRASGTISLLDRTWAQVNIASVSPVTSGAAEYRVDYDLLGSESSSAAGVAQAYRRILLQNGGTGNIRSRGSLFLDVYQSVRTKKEFLGVPYVTTEPLTTFEELETVTDDLQSAGVNSIHAVLKGLDSDGAGSGRIDTTVSVSRSLGGMKALKSLSSKEGITLYPECNLFEIGKNGNGLYSFLDTAVNVSYKNIKKYSYRLSTYEKDITKPIRSLVRADRLTYIFTSLSNSLKKNSITAVSIGSGADTVYSDMSENSFGINRTGQTVIDGLGTLSGNAALIARHPMGYAIPYLTAVEDLPSVSNRFFAADYELPLIPMIMDGITDYTLSAFNQSGDMKRLLLRSIESKGSLLFETTAADYSRLKDTELADLYGIHYDSRKKQMIDFMKALGDALDGLWDQPITDYRIINENVRVITYQNGTTLTVNYGNEPYTDGTTEAAPMSYCRVDAQNN